MFADRPQLNRIKSASEATLGFLKTCVLIHRTFLDMWSSGGRRQGDARQDRDVLPPRGRPARSVIHGRRLPPRALATGKSAMHVKHRCKYNRLLSTGNSIDGQSPESTAQNKPGLLANRTGFAATCVCRCGRDVLRTTTPIWVCKPGLFGLDRGSRRPSFEGLSMKPRFSKT